MKYEEILIQSQKIIHIINKINQNYITQCYSYLNQNIIELISLLKDYINNVSSCDIDYMNLTQFINKLLLAYECNDYVYINLICQNDGVNAVKNIIQYLNDNGIYISLENVEYDSLSNDKNELINKTLPIEIPDSYILETTSEGFYTLKISKKSDFYMHSCYTPDKEAVQIAASIYASCKGIDYSGEKEVIVLGLGLGYIINALSEYKDITKITVIETDINIISLTLNYVGFSIFNNEKINLIYDPELEKFKNIINKKDTIIIAVGTIYEKLYSFGIIPDYVLVTDGSDLMGERMSSADTTISPLIYLSTVNYKVPLMWKNDRFILFQKDYLPAEEYVEKNFKNKEYSLCQTGGSVSTTAFDIGLLYNCKRIVTIGLDLAFYNKKSHASASKSIFDIKNDTYDIYVKSNENEKLLTCRSFNIYRKWLERRIEKRTQKEKNIELINCSKGAYIEGMRYCKIEEIIEIL